MRPSPASPLTLPSPPRRGGEGRVRGGLAGEPDGTGIRKAMVNRNLLRQYDLPELELQEELEAAFQQDETGVGIDAWLPPEEQQFEVNKIVKGRVLNIIGDEVVVDVGYKSE